MHDCMYTHTHCSLTSVRGLQESLLNGWNELFWDVHADRLVVKLQLGQFLARQWFNVTNDATILTCATTLFFVQIVEATT